MQLNRRLAFFQITNESIAGISQARNIQLRHFFSCLYWRSNAPNSSEDLIFAPASMESTFALSFFI